MSLELRVVKIKAFDLEEGGDEIYLRAIAKNNQHDVRPSGSPDYWRFDSLGSRSMDVHVATLTGRDPVDVKLMEQDNAPANPHDTIGVITPFLNENTGLTWGESQSGQYLGQDSIGHKVEFKNPAARYQVWFRAIPH